MPQPGANLFACLTGFVSHAPLSRHSAVSRMSPWGGFHDPFPGPFHDHAKVRSVVLSSPKRGRECASRDRRRGAGREFGFAFRSGCCLSLCLVGGGRRRL